MEALNIYAKYFNNCFMTITKNTNLQFYKRNNIAKIHKLTFLKYFNP